MNMTVESAAVALVDDRYGHHIKVLTLRLQVNVKALHPYSSWSACKDDAGWELAEQC